MEAYEITSRGDGMTPAGTRLQDVVQQIAEMSARLNGYAADGTPLNKEGGHLRMPASVSPADMAWRFQDGRVIRIRDLADSVLKWEVVPTLMRLVGTLNARVYELENKKEAASSSEAAAQVTLELLR